jgi:hypothetical protein
MSALRSTRSAQYILHGSFTYDLSTGDTLGNTASPSVVQALGATGAGPFDAIKLPKGARVVGGQLTVVTVSNDTGAATLAVGDSGSASRYLAATSIKTAARTALVPTGFTGIGEDIRITLVNTNGDATTGKVTLDVSYIIDGKSNEVVPN